MAYFWLQDENSNTLYLDDYVQELTLGGVSRDYKLVDYAGSPGGYVQGWGQIGARKLKVSRKEKAISTDPTFMGTRRNDFVKWFLYPKFIQLWFYVTDSNSVTMKTRAYVNQIGDEKTSYFKLSDPKDFEIILPNGVFEKTTATTGSEAITSSTQQQKVITNAGTYECPLKVAFTPTAQETYFQVLTVDEFGIRIEGTLLAGVKYEYDTSDNSLTIDGIAANASQYITAGSVFNLNVGSNTLYINCSGAGSFTYSYYERYV